MLQDAKSHAIGHCSSRLKFLVSLLQTPFCNLQMHKVALQGANKNRTEFQIILLIFCLPNLEQLVPVTTDSPLSR